APKDHALAGQRNTGRAGAQGEQGRQKERRNDQAEIADRQPEFYSLSRQLEPAKGEKGGPEDETGQEAPDTVAETEREVASRAVGQRVRRGPLPGGDPVVNAARDLATNEVTEQMLDHVGTPSRRRVYVMRCRA